MMKQVLGLVTMLCTAGLMISPAFATSTSGTDNNETLAQHLAPKTPTKNLFNSDVPYIPSVSISPYIGVPSHFDGSDLIVNNPSINENVKLLQLRQAERAYLKSKGVELAETPHLIFSGEIESQLSYANPYNGSDSSDIDLTDAELDMFLGLSHWFSGYMTFVYDNAPVNSATPYDVDNSNIYLDQGFVTVGDFDISPWYMTVGQFYMPFGRYSSFMVTSPLTKSLGRIKARAIEAGYQASASDFTPHAQVFAFRGDANPSDDADNIKVFGGDVGFAFDHGSLTSSLGFSAVSEIAESQGIQGDGDSTSSTFDGLSQYSSYENLDHRVPGVDVYGSVGCGSWSLLGEYTAAARSFDSSDVSYNGSGAQPMAADIEAAYAFHFTHPSSIAISYQHSWEALAFNLPEQRIAATYTVSVWRHTLLSLEVDHDIGYSSGDSASGPAGAAIDTSQLGNSFNSVILQLDAYF
ncbi:MAG: LbtU family siderophore porin [Gammaproteobacteria bacterium]